MPSLAIQMTSTPYSGSREPGARGGSEPGAWDAPPLNRLAGAWAAPPLNRLAVTVAESLSLTPCKGGNLYSKNRHVKWYLTRARVVLPLNRFDVTIKVLRHYIFAMRLLVVKYMACKLLTDTAIKIISNNYPCQVPLDTTIKATKYSN